MSNSPLVSIVIPTYNQHENFLRECIESAIDQTYPNIEIVICDNHSTNGASDIIAAYAETDSRIRVVKPPQFLSLIENFIFAYNKVKGEYICPLSSDDILYPEMVAEQLDPFFSYPDLSFSCSKPLFFVTDINKAKWVPSKKKTGIYQSDEFLDFFINYRECGWGGLLVKTSNYNKVGGFKKELRFTGDVDVLFKLILLEGGIYFLNKPLSAIRLWEREEQDNRVPNSLAENSGIFEGIISKGLADKNRALVKLGTKAKWNIFATEAYQIPYFIQFKKRSPETIEKRISIIKETYPKGIFNFVLDNRKNLVGLSVSIAFLSYAKLKSLFKRK